MTITANLADGTILRFPDGTDESVIQAKVKELSGGSTITEEQFQEQYASPEAMGEIPSLGGAPAEPVQQVEGEQPSIGDYAYGALETGVGTVAGGARYGGEWLKQAIFGIADQIASGEIGSYEAAERLRDTVTGKAAKAAERYMPTTKVGQEMMGAVGEFGEAMAPIATPMMGMVQPLQVAQQLENVAPVVGEMAREQTQPSVQMPSTRSMGAAETSLVRQRIEKARGLPEPIEMTKGAATREPSQLAFEKEAAKQPQTGEKLRVRAEENNLQILKNFDAFMDMTGAEAPDVAATGNTVIDALMKGYKEAKIKTRVAYADARKSEEAKTPVDTLQQVTVGPEDDPMTMTVWEYIDSKPRGVSSSAFTDSARATAIKMGIAQEDENGNLIPTDNVTVGSLEDFRKELNRMVNTGDNVAVRDASILKDLIDGHTSQVEGDLYKKARKIRKEQGDKFEDRAIVIDLINTVKGRGDAKVPADKVFNRTILTRSPEEIRFLKKVLYQSGNEGKQAWRELQGATIRHIQEESTKGLGMGANDQPNVSPAQLNKIVKQLDKNGRLDIVFGKHNADVIRDLNDVVQYISTVPPNTLINASGTAGMILAALTEMGALGYSGVLPVPVLTTLKFIRDKYADKKLKDKIDEALKGFEE